MNKLRLCTSCKERKPVDAMIKIHGGWFCDISCATNLAIKRRDKSTAKYLKMAQAETKKKNAKHDREFYENDPKTRAKAAKTACHLYIRTRDKGLPCICCGRPHKKTFQAGHFLESGNYSHLRYDERNIHAQSVYCNQYKGGNSDDYEARLRIKIGNEAVDEMKASKSKVTKRTVQDYKEIELYYKQKLKELLSCDDQQNINIL